MDRARAHTFRVIAVSAALLVAGFSAGFYGVLIFAHAGKKRVAQKHLAAGTIMTKRKAAIDAALKNGRTEYEFNFVSPVPVLGRQ